MKNILIALLAICMVVVTGCNKANETLAQLKDDLQQEVVAPTPEGSQETEQEQDTNQLQVPDMDDITIEETYEPVQTIGNSQNEQIPSITVSLYFADETGTSLVQTSKAIPKVEGMARATVETLLEGPETDSGLKAPVPAGTELLDINLKAEDKLCIVDFSRELAEQIEENGVTEEVVVYSIANTLCQFPSIEQVEFRIEGQTVTTLKGQSDLSAAVCANSALVK